MWRYNHVDHYGVSAPDDDLVDHDPFPHYDYEHYGVSAPDDDLVDHDPSPHHDLTAHDLPALITGFRLE
jgi:hypothetical protein